MTDLLAARSQMAVSLAFHIVFAATGVGLPLLLLLAEGAWLRTGEPVYLRLARAWAKGLAVLFAVGAVSGTVLSFELGLLWPRFMEVAGPLIGVPFSLEGLAFFTEAIFLGIYLYGWQRVPAWAHFAAGLVVAVSAAASALFVLSVNGWMNAPTGYLPGQDGQPASIDPWAAMVNPFWIANTAHMLFAAYVATAFGAVAIHAWKLSRGADPSFHGAGVRIGIVVGALMAILQPLSGDVTAGIVATAQPAKLAAMEAHFRTSACAPLRIGGIPSEADEDVAFGLTIPCGLSLLVAHDPDAVVPGLDQVPRDLWPPVAPVYVAFQTMVAIGIFLSVLGVWTLIRLMCGLPLHRSRWLRWALIASGPLSFLAIEAGWVVTEVGRQPWIVYGVMRTPDALTPMPRLVVPFAAVTLLYVFLAAIVVTLMLRISGDEGRGPEPLPT